MVRVESKSERKATILFAPRIAPLIREVNWHPTQQIWETDNGFLRFEVRVAGWREIGCRGFSDGGMKRK